MNFTSKFKLRRWGEMNPLWWPLISWALTIGGFSLGEVLIRLVGWSNKGMHVLLPFLVSVAMLAPFVALVILAASFRRNAKALGRIICLYVALILLCANINFIIMLNFGQSAQNLPFHGIQPVWGEPVEGRPVPFLWDNAFQSIIDCIHFSVATLSTVGYGEIYPTAWYSKLVVDVEILMGLGITVLTVGRYFSRGGEP